MMSDEVDLFSQQEANRRRSQWLIVGFVLFFAWLGFGGDIILHEYTVGAAEGSYQHTFPWFGIVLTVFAAALTWWAWRTGSETVLAASGASEIISARTPQEQQLVNVVEEMAIASGIPRPRIWLIADPDPNAFATGRDPASASIAVTEGLIACCTRDELQGVIAHEMGHVKNLDVRLMTLLAAMVGAIALVSEMMSRMLRSGGLGRGRGGRGGKKGGGGPLLALLLVLWIVSWMLAPILARVLALGVSRKREYLADAMSAQFTRNPMALADALGKIEHAHAPTRAIKRGTAHLCIADPLGMRVNTREGRLADFFGTHPPMSVRIARLKGMAYRDAKRESATLPESDPARSLG